jgi:hypothetical protein
MWDGFDLPGSAAHEMRGFGDTPLPPSGEFSHWEDPEKALGEEQAALVGASFGGLVYLELPPAGRSSCRSSSCSGAPLPDHDCSRQIESYDEHEAPS